jgi:hypothetical protein
MKIVLISCASKKLKKKAKVKNLYFSPLFKLNLKYAKSLRADKIFVLSAKYGLLNLNEEIEPYNLTLNEMSEKEIKEWASKVLNQLKKEADLEKDEFIFLAGEKYRKFLLPDIKNYKTPTKGMGIGKQLQFLKQKTNNKCQEIHELFNSMKRHSFPFNEAEIPKNGIYILFEKGERGHGGDRIVRIGTHTGKDQLRSRLKQHFMNKNKDRSIFRKNIGRNILNKNKDPFLKQWELDLTTKKAKQKHKHINFEKQNQVEEKVSKYIQNNFSFVILPIENKKKRKEIESKIISTVSLCDYCRPSKRWFCLFSPKQKIRESGLWLINELYKEPLKDEDIQELKKLAN